MAGSQSQSNSCADSGDYNTKSFFPWLGKGIQGSVKPLSGRAKRNTREIIGILQLEISQKERFLTSNLKFYVDSEEHLDRTIYTEKIKDCVENRNVQKLENAISQLEKLQEQTSNSLKLGFIKDVREGYDTLKSIQEYKEKVAKFEAQQRKNADEATAVIWGTIVGMLSITVLLSCCLLLYKLSYQ